MAAAENTNPTKDDPAGGVPLGTRHTIFPAMPLAEYNGPGGAAFASRGKNEAHYNQIGILCSSILPTRAGFLNSFRTTDNMSLMRVRDGDVVFWTPSNSYHYVLIYDRPSNPRYWKSLDETHHSLNEDVLNRVFLSPMANALAELQRIGITHGGIRPTNIYWQDGSASAPQLGEFLSAPAGIGQPVLFETIERGLCSPSMRGPGQHVDDMYALGVTMALMIIGCNPLKGMDDHTISQMKMERGSFAALIGNHRLAGSQIELLRGLLTDDAHQRWTAADLQEWLGGRRLTPKSAEAGRRATRSILFMGKEYWQARPLAAALSKNVAEAAKLIENNALSRWLLRSLDAHDDSEVLEEAIEGMKEGGGSGANYEDRLVTRVCIAIDPHSPIRYKNMAFMPDALPVALAEIIANNASPQIISEIISYQFVSFWVNAQKESKVDWVPTVQQIERLRGAIEKSQLGSGIERALYELNPFMPCLSPMMRGQMVLSPKMLLPALERTAASGNHASEPMDRHIAAFLAVRDRRGEALFAQMSPPHPSVHRALAILTLYGEMQYRFGPESLPALSKWLVSLLEPSLKRFFNKPLREKMRKQLKEVADKGSLSALQGLLDDPVRLSRDENDFIIARQMYQNVTREIAEVSGRLSNRSHLMNTVGKPLAASLSSLFSILLISFVVIRAFWRMIG